MKYYINTTSAYIEVEITKRKSKEYKITLVEISENFEIRRELYSKVVKCYSLKKFETWLNKREIEYDVVSYYSIIERIERIGLHVERPERSDSYSYNFDLLMLVAKNLPLCDSYVELGKLCGIKPYKARRGVMALHSYGSNITLDFFDRKMDKKANRYGGQHEVI